MYLAYNNYQKDLMMRNNRRNFVKKMGMLAMATAMPDIINSTPDITKEKSLTLKRSKIKVDDRWLSLIHI